MYETEQKKERVILVGISLSDAEDVDQSLDELEELARTAGAECVGRVIYFKKSWIYLRCVTDTADDGHFVADYHVRCQSLVLNQ